MTSDGPAPVDPQWLAERLTLADHPRSATYDPQWMVDNCMGPNPLWLLEDLSADLDLRPGMRVLDLGCGRAMTSIFLAQQYDVRVWATDLWVPAAENWTRIEAAGLGDEIVPIHAEAHDLPFADGFFDAIVSIDAYQYFGTDDLYLGYLRRFLKPGGQLGIAVPSVIDEVNDVPEHLRPYWEWDFACFHTADWWRRHWTRSGLMTVEVARNQPDGARLWRDWSEACAVASDSEFIVTGSRQSVEMLDVDAGRTFTFSLVVGRVAETAGTSMAR